MTFVEVMGELASSGTERNRNVYRRHGFGDNQYGVSFANLNKLAKAIRKNNELAGQLWATGNGDARNLATLIADPKTISRETLLAWISTITCYVHADLIGAKVAAKHPEAAALMARCMKSKQEFAQQVGWDIASVAAVNGGLSDAEADRLLRVIEKSIAKAPNRARHAMNSALIAIGLRGPAFKKKAIAAARRIGKVEVDHGETGCVTPDAESYIRKAAARKKAKTPR
jgi:3-methyladenine DNA glycosylase AlkD